MQLHTKRGRRAKPSPSVAEYLHAWLDGKRSLRPSTRLAYRIHIRLYLAPLLGEVRLAELTPHDIDSAYGALLDETDPDRPPMSVLNSAVRRGLIDRNPAASVDVPSAPRPRPTVWSPAELARFLETAGDDDLYPVFVLLALLGLRRGEAVGLRCDDVDLDAGPIRVRPPAGRCRPRHRGRRAEVQGGERPTAISTCSRRRRRTPRTRCGRWCRALRSHTVLRDRPRRRRRPHSR
jgi:integrase